MSESRRCMTSRSIVSDLHLAVREVQDRAAGRLIHAADLHADEAVLDHVHAADAVFAAELVQRLHHAERGQRLAVHGDAVALLEIERDVLRLVRRVLGEARRAVK